MLSSLYHVYFISLLLIYNTYKYIAIIKSICMCFKIMLLNHRFKFTFYDEFSMLLLLLLFI
ncbi:hypothetical protein CNEO3_290010 [Clostridium neonatale]|nr:hypothetical protein CNEO3_290010 [Clostridium neonatale]